MYGMADMHYIAQAIAIEKGPRLVYSQGQKLAIFGLTKQELVNIYTDHGFSPRRKTWLNQIQDWGSDVYSFGDLIASNFFQENSWKAYVVFVNLSKEEIVKLKMYAEENDARAIYRESDDSDMVEYDFSSLIDITKEAKNSTIQTPLFSGGMDV